MESPSKHRTKSRLAAKVVIILHKTILVKLNRNLVNEISHLPYRKETKFHEELQDIHPLHMESSMGLYKERWKAP